MTAGPCETGQQAPDLPDLAATGSAAHASGRQGVTGSGRHRLCKALARVQVERGSFDHQILPPMAGYGPQTSPVVAGLATRAAAGSLVGRAGLPAMRGMLADVVAWEQRTRRRAGVSRYRELARALAGDP